MTTERVERVLIDLRANLSLARQADTVDQAAPYLRALGMVVEVLEQAVEEETGRRVLRPWELTAADAMVTMGYEQRWVKVREPVDAPDDAEPTLPMDVLISRGTQPMDAMSLAALEACLASAVTALGEAATAVALTQAMLRRVSVAEPVDTRA